MKRPQTFEVSVCSCGEGPCGAPHLEWKEVEHGDWMKAEKVWPILSTLYDALHVYRASHRECVDLTGDSNAMPSQRKDWRCANCKIVDELK